VTPDRFTEDAAAADDGDTEPAVDAAGVLVEAAAVLAVADFEDEPHAVAVTASARMAPTAPTCASRARTRCRAEALVSLTLTLDTHPPGESISMKLIDYIT
jgi:hypothetical protein